MHFEGFMSRAFFCASIGLSGGSSRTVCRNLAAVNQGLGGILDGRDEAKRRGKAAGGW